MRVLDARNVQVREEITVRGEAPNRAIYRGDMAICNEADDYTRVVPFLLDAGKLNRKTVAWIGGGFCIGPMAFAIADCRQTVYEGESCLREFCPDGIAFVAGDWRDTIRGSFDVVIFDLGGPVPYAELSNFLSVGGIILPKESS
jgi:hypothetical protein